MPRVFRRGAPPLERWKQVCEAGVATVERLRLTSPLETIQPASWLEKMVAYHTQRINQLLAQAPKGQQGFVRAMRRRLRVK